MYTNGNKKEPNHKSAAPKTEEPENHSGNQEDPDSEPIGNQEDPD